ncbi:hypothetical protein CISIN_1g0208382mg, partial [Citrus sinensis]
DLGRSILALIL